MPKTIHSFSGHTLTSHMPELRKVLQTQTAKSLSVNLVPFKKTTVHIHSDNNSVLQGKLKCDFLFLILFFIKVFPL